MGLITHNRLVVLILVVSLIFVAVHFEMTTRIIHAQSDINSVLLEDDFYQEKTPSLIDKNIPRSTFFAQNQQSTVNFPNIIVIITDDQPPNTLGIAGNSVIKTPNIDSLGNTGIYFKNMYLVSGQCSPSRSSLWTGKLPHTHGVVTNGPALPADQLTLPEILKANGYQMAAIGKCSLGRDLKNDLGFDFYLEVGGYVPNWYDYWVDRNGVSEHQTEYITDFLTREAIGYLKSAAQQQKSNKKPIFLWFAPTAPHVPTTPPQGSNRYSLAQLPQPASEADDLSTKPPQQSLSAHQGYLGWGKTRVRERLKDAYEVISDVDDDVGKLLRVLNDLGLRENTVIIYLSDNGLFYGEHQLFQKGPYFYEEVIKTPFIFSYPKMFSQGERVDALVSSIDFFPTLLDLLGIPIPADVQGKSFLPVLRGETTQFRQSIYMEYAKQGNNEFPMRGVVMDGYKFVHYLRSTINGVVYDGKNFELYNLRSDPYEMNNLMKRLGPNDDPFARIRGDPQSGIIVRRLVREMAVWQTDTADPVRKIISNPSATPLSSGAVQLTWKTTEPLTSEVEYREAGCSSCSYNEVYDFTPLADHKIELKNLKPKTTYVFKIFSLGGNGNGAYAELKTKTLGITGDLNNDGKVDIYDYNLLITDFGKSGSSGFSSADLDGNGKVDIFDYNILVGNFGRTQ